MRIHRHITVLAAAVAATTALTPVAGALAAPNRAGGAPSVPQHVSARTYSTGARYVPEQVWREINDAMLVKLLNRQ